MTSVSGDGRYVAFASRANRPEDDDLKSDEDIFIQDRLTKRVTLVSPPTSNPWLNCMTKPSIAASGTILAYLAGRSFRVAGDVPTTCTGNTVVVRDLVRDRTSLVGQARAVSMKISGDGRWIAAHEIYDEHCPEESGCTNMMRLAIYATETGQLVWASRTICICSNQAAGVSISGDGRFVTVDARGSPADDNPVGPIYVWLHDRDADEDQIFDEPSGMSDTPVSIPPGSIAPVSGRSGEISADGSTVAFVVGDGVYVRDISAGVSRSAGSVGNYSAPANWDRQIAISADGGSVAYATTRPHSQEDLNSALDIYVWSALDGSLRLVSVPPEGTQIPLLGFNPAMDSTGGLIGFTLATPASDEDADPVYRGAYVRIVSAPCILLACDQGIPGLPPLPLPSQSTNELRKPPFDFGGACYYIADDGASGFPSRFSDRESCSDVGAAPLFQLARTGHLAIGGAGWLQTPALYGYLAGVREMSATSLFLGNPSPQLKVGAVVEGSTQGNYSRSLCLTVWHVYSGAHLGVDCLERPTSLRNLSVTIDYSLAPYVAAWVRLSSTKDVQAGAVQLKEISFTNLG